MFLINLKLRLKFAIIRLLAFIVSWRYCFKPREYQGYACILRNDYLGDFFLSLPVLKAFSDYYRERGIRTVIFTSESMHSFIQSTGLFDAAVAVDHIQMGRSFRKRIMTYAWLRHVVPAVFISLICLPEERLGINDYIAYFIAAKEKFACALPPFAPDSLSLHQAYFHLGNHFYTHKLELTAIKPLIEMETALFSLVSGKSLISPCRYDFLEKIPAFPLLSGNYCVLVPGASDIRRRWPIENFCKVAAEIHRLHPELQIVILGTAKERFLADTIAGKVPENTILNLCGETGIADVIAIIREAKFVLTNDTGTSHIAGILGVKTVCVLGGGHFGIYAPCERYTSVHYVYDSRECFLCGWNCKCRHADINKAYPCIAQVSTDTVNKTLSEIFIK